MTAWFCAAAISAVVELDSAAAGQFMISRPIVLGPVLGLILGHPALGAGLGVVCELFCLEELPVGGSLPLNATIAVAAALLLASGPAPMPPELAFPAGLLTGWAHAKAESFLRRRRAGLNGIVEQRLRSGQSPGLGGLAARELARQAVTTLALLGGVMMLGGAFRRFWMPAPVALRSGLHLSLAVSPWIGLWSLARSFKVVS